MAHFQQLELRLTSQVSRGIFFSRKTSGSFGEGVRSRSFGDGSCFIRRSR
jgi:hypothetical protein